MERRRPRVQFATTGHSRAKQAFKDECDVNTIMRRFEQTGVIEHVNRYQGSYGDFTEVPENYQAAVNQVIAAQDMFMSLPAKVRARFANDPGNFLAFVEDPNNADEMVSLGLASRREADPQAPTPEGPTPAAPAEPAK